ncbi:hypothetical protein GCK32_011285 [Trichostrongylus colubriformis]|uniref:Uncharacterized protein n=1 Tax=Trichostrongylus colubriformis TaxID=6319 RepID=A0AAN8J1Y3_TRICO
MWLRLRWTGIIVLLGLCSAADHAARTAESRFPTTDEEEPSVAEKRDGVVITSGDHIDKDSPQRRVPKQISRQTQAEVERSAAAPVGRAPTTLLVRHPHVIRRQPLAPRSPPRFQGVQPRLEDFRQRQRPVAIRRTQIRRVPLSQAAHIRKPALVIIGNLTKSASQKDPAESSSRRRTVPLPPVEPPRHWTRNRPRVRLHRPTNKPLTDLRAPPRTSSTGDRVVRVQTDTVGIISDSDVEKAVLKAITESSTASSSRRNGRIRRPLHRTSAHRASKRPVPTRKDETPPTPSPNGIRTTIPPAMSANEVPRVSTKTTASPRTNPVINANPQAIPNVGPVLLVTPTAIAAGPEASTPPSLLSLFSASRRRVTSLLNRTANQHNHNISRGLHRQSSTTLSHHSFTPATRITTTEPTMITVPLPDAPTSMEERPSREPRLFTVATPSPNVTPPRAATSLEIRDSEEVQAVTTQNAAHELQNSVNVTPETVNRKTVVDHSTSNEDPFDIDPALLNRKAAIISSLKHLPLSEATEGSADSTDGDPTTVFTTSAASSTSSTTTFPAFPSSPFVSTDNNATQEITLHPTPFPLSSFRDPSAGTGALREELNQNLVEEGTTTTLTPPPPSSSSATAAVSTQQEAGAPGAAPPNDSVVEALNRAENFMEIARTLRIHRSDFPQKRQRRWIKIEGEVRSEDDLQLVVL